MPATTTSKRHSMNSAAPGQRERVPHRGVKQVEVAPIGRYASPWKADTYSATIGPVAAGDKVVIITEGIVVLLVAVLVFVLVVMGGLAEKAHKARPARFRREP